jgi:hypothetical protein
MRRLAWLTETQYRASFVLACTIWAVIDLRGKITAGLMGEILRHVYRLLI